MSFICPTIKKEIESRHHKSETKKTFHGQCVPKRKNFSFPYTITVVMCDTTEPYDMDALIELVRFLILWIVDLKWSTSISSLDVRLDLTQHKKQWCWKQTSIIDKCNINSGETEFDGLKRVIRIWRREDYHKVLIHELLHAFNWDRLIPHLPKSQGRQSEAMVEAVAFILHAKLLGGPTNFRAILTSERAWSATLTDLLFQKSWSTRDTNVKEYIILKSSLVLTDRLFDKFLAWLNLPSEHECVEKWSELLSENMIELKQLDLSQIYTTQIPYDNEQCSPLNLVKHQLTLNPRLKK